MLYSVEFKTDVKGYVKDNLYVLEDLEVRRLDLIDVIFENAFADGTLTYSTWGAVQWLSNYYFDIIHVIGDIKATFGDEYTPDFWEEPERLMIDIVDYVGRDILDNCCWLHELYNNDNEKLIIWDAELIEELEKHL